MQNVLIIGNLMPANKPMFNEVESILKHAGHSVTNPAKEYTLTMDDKIYFTRRYLDSLTAVTAVYYLPDFWQLPNSDILQKVAKALSLLEMNQFFPVSKIHCEISEATNF